MTIYYVSSIHGNNSNSGSQTAPLATLQAAAELVKPGDTVEVMNGTYSGYYWGDVLDITTSGTPSAPITFEAAPGQHPLINSANCWNGINVQASYIKIEGFTVEGDAGSYSLAQAQAQEDNIEDPIFDGNGITVQQPSSGAVPNHIIIQGNTVFNEPGGGISASGADYIQILNNIVHNNSYWSPYDNSGISIYQSANSDHAPGIHDIISGNTSYSNADRIPDAFTGTITDGEGIILDTNTNFTGIIEVENNTAFGNSGPGIEDYLTNNAIITRNTAYANLTNPSAAHDGQIFINQSTGTTITNNTTVAPGPGAIGGTSQANIHQNSNLAAASGADSLPTPVTTPIAGIATGSGRSVAADLSSALGNIENTGSAKASTVMKFLAPNGSGLSLCGGESANTLLEPNISRLISSLNVSIAPDFTTGLIASGIPSEGAIAGYGQGGTEGAADISNHVSLLVKI